MATTVSGMEIRHRCCIGAFDIDGDGTLGANSGDIEYDSGDLGLPLLGYAANGAWIFRSTFSAWVDQTLEPGVIISDLNFKRLIWDLTAGTN